MVDQDNVPQMMIIFILKKLKISTSQCSHYKEKFDDVYHS